MDADSSAAKAAAKKERPSDPTDLYHQHFATVKGLAEATDSSAVDEMSDDSLAGRSLESTAPLPRSDHDIPTAGIPRHHKNLRQDSFFSTTSAGSFKSVGTLKTVVEEDLLEPSSPRFVKATPTSHLPWSPPQGIPNLPPVGTSHYRLGYHHSGQRRRRRERRGCAVSVESRLGPLTSSDRYNAAIGMCVGLKDLPQGRYGWSCKECDPDDTTNGLFSINDNVEWQGDDEDGL
ncbi:hypothetical protein LTR12_008309 [Friedmanniomyces endolithicus]|nr:hypothetical protein LTR12_008309 [Friedmanniomyces endolithicus]